MWKSEITTSNSWTRKISTQFAKLLSLSKQEVPFQRICPLISQGRSKCSSIRLTQRFKTKEMEQRLRRLCLTFRTSDLKLTLKEGLQIKAILNHQVGHQIYHTSTSLLELKYQAMTKGISLLDLILRIEGKLLSVGKRCASRNLSRRTSRQLSTSTITEQLSPLVQPPIKIGMILSSQSWI